MSFIEENQSQKPNSEQLKPEADVKIAAENKVYTQEEAKQQIQDSIDKLNQRMGQEIYTIAGTPISYDAYGIETIKFNIKYLGQNLTTIEACLSANADGLRRGVNLDSENITILLAAATIQLKGSLSKDGYLVKNGH